MAALRGRVVSHDGHVQGEPFEIAPPNAVAPTVAPGGGIYLAAWREEDLRLDQYGREIRTGFRIVARRIDADGKLLDAQPIVVATETDILGRSSQTSETLAAASDPTQFLVVWPSADLRIRGARITHGGTLLDSVPFPVSGGLPAERGAPAADWTGSDFRVIWIENPPFPPVYDNRWRTANSVTRATRLSTNGTILDASFPVLAENRAGLFELTSRFGAASNGRELLVAWSPDR